LLSATYLTLLNKNLEVECSKTGISGSFTLKLLDIDENITQFLDNKQIASGGRYFEISENTKISCMNIYKQLQNNPSNKNKYNTYVMILSKIEENSPYFFVDPDGHVIGTRKHAN